MTEKTEVPLDKDAAESQEIQVSNWLHRLKEESWEAELLVSAVAIFGTFQLFAVVDWTTDMLINVIPPEQYFIGYFFAFTALLAVSTLSTMFVIHFFLRAYWVGLVGLNSVFPDYSLKESFYSEIYTEKILSILPKLKESIDKVDQLCSVIFSAAFSILLMLFHYVFVIGLCLLLYNSLLEYIPRFILLAPAVLFITVLVIQSLVAIVANLKMFKTHTNIQHIYFKVMQLSSLILMGPFYKNILQIFMMFASNFKKNKALVKLTLVFGISGICVTIFQFNNTNIPYLLNAKTYFDKNAIYPNYYYSENLKNDNFRFLLTPEIPADIITVSTFQVFIPIFRNERRLYKQHCDLAKQSIFSSSAIRINVKQQYFDCIQSYHHIELNGKQLTPHFKKYEHPISNQFGLIAYVQLQNNQYGKNILTIRKQLAEDDVIKQWDIPFYYAKK